MSDASSVPSVKGIGPDASGGAKWLPKYYEDLASGFGALSVLAFGGFVFVILASILVYGFNWITGLILVGFIVSGFGALFLVKYFSQRSLPEPQNFIYIVSDRSLQTLVAAGVPEDVTQCLEDLRMESKAPVLVMETNSESPANWLDRLKTELGEERVSEFEDTLLRYTRRRPETE